MSVGTVEEILRQIDALPVEDRRLLEERLAEHAETEWRREAEAARRVASERGLDQAAIDAAVQAVRYRPQP